MGHQIVEIKARCADAARVREILRREGADFRGEDHQIDTYFRCAVGRLKLREGNIENNLIFYRRANEAGPKLSKVELFPVRPNSNLRAMLSGALGVLVTVDKRREIYFIENVKFHVDRVERLGDFVEIEAIDLEGNLGEKFLRTQCDRYIALLGIDRADLVDRSYSDLLLAETK